MDPLDVEQRQIHHLERDEAIPTVAYDQQQTFVQKPDLGRLRRSNWSTAHD